MPAAAIRYLSYVGGISVIAAIYYGAATFGLRLASVHPSATTFWAPTGIAFTVLLLAGFQYWPGIFVGAFVTNLLTYGTMLTSLIIAAGNTLEAFIIAIIVATYAGAERVFENLSTVGVFIVAVFAGGVTSTSIGVGTLNTFNLADPTILTTISAVWLLGNMGGAVVVAPILISWWNNPRISWSRAQYIEFIAVVCGVLLTAYIIFGPPSVPFNFLAAPILGWAIIRFSTREAMSAFALFAALAVLGTLMGYGPFAAHSLPASLLYLQAYVIVVGMSVLALSATVAERREIEVSLKKADRSKDEFLATLSHELRNPLTTVVSYAQLLTYGKRTSDERTMLDNMQKEVEYITLLLEDLLDLSRIRRGRIELKKALVDVSDLVRDAAQGAQIHMEERKLSFRVESESPLYVYGDATRIKQMLVNLLTNAAKYTDEGSVVLSARQKGDMIVVDVSDTGIGLAPERIPLLFDEATMREAISLRHSRAGLGIGLSLVSRLALLHGGSLSATSGGIGKGSVFTLQLPRASTEMIPVPETLRLPQIDEVSTRHRSQPLSVFVVDDNTRSADALVSLLENFGYTAEPLYSGRALLKRLATKHPDVILLDIELGDMNGHDVAEKIGALDLHPKPILIAVSGYGSEGQIEKSRGQGFFHYLVKPINISQLREILSRL